MRAGPALDRSTCDRARIARDPRFDGAFFTGVMTTRIYCRPTCPVKPAKSRNVVFFPTAAAAERAGFRPCLRCRPEAAPGTPARRRGDGLTRAATHRARIPRRRQEGWGPRGHARYDSPAPAPIVRAPRGRLTDRRRDDPARAARESPGRRDGDADVRDRVRGGVRQHPTLQRRVSRGLPEAADGRSPSQARARRAPETPAPRGSETVGKTKSGSSDVAEPPVSFGGPSGTRTPDPLIKSQLLCQLS